MVFEPGVFDTLTGRISPRDRRARAARAEGQLAAYRHDGFWQCMDTLRDKRLLERHWESGTARRGKCGRDAVLARSADLRDRRHRACRRLAGARAFVDAGADAGLPGSRLGAGERARARRTHRSGDDACGAMSRDQALLERMLGEYEIDTVIHLAAQTIVAHREPQSGLDVRDEHRGTWSLLEACRRSPTVQADRGRVVGQGVRRPASLPYDETTPLQGAHPYDVSKSCADLIAQTYAVTYGCRSPSRAAATSTAAAI